MALQYLEQFLAQEKNTDQELWDALKDVENPEIKDRLHKHLLDFFQTTTATACKNVSAKILLMSHPDQAKNIAGLDFFVKAFILASFKKRKELSV